METKKSGAFIVTGQAYWAKVQEPDETDRVYSLEVTLTPEMLSTVKSMGITTGIKDRTDKGYGWVLHAKTWGYSQDGTLNKLRVIDKEGKPFTDLIGNGSTVKVEVVPYAWTFAGRSGVRPLLKGVKVLEHVPYKKSLLDSDEEASDYEFASQQVADASREMFA
jgi:hypothetical protein